MHYAMLDTAVPATLNEILSARDSRAERHTRLAAENPDKTLLALTVIVPGNVKRSSGSLTIAHAACSAVLCTFNKGILSSQEFDRATGYEADFIIDRPAEEVKRIAVAIEEKHPLGRLFDLDVIHTDGRPMSRSEIGLPDRKCLCCNRPARFCMRAHSHSFEEVAANADSIIDRYIAGELKTIGINSLSHTDDLL